ERRIVAPGPQGGDEERGGGRLAVGPGGTDRLHRCGDRVQQPGTPPYLDPRLPGRHQFGVGVGDRRRRHHQVGASHPIRSMTGPDLGPGVGEEVEDGSAPQVRAGDTMSLADQDLGQRAHPGAGHSDQMDRRWEAGHVPPIAIRAAAMVSAAWGRARAAVAAPIFSRWAGRDTRPETTVPSVASCSSGTTSAAPTLARAEALAAWWPVEPKPPGTRMAGVAVAVSSATEPPARATTRSQAAKNSS